MKLIIDIPEEMIKALEQGAFGAKYNMYDLVGCVMNGTPLPKGHGALIDRDELANNDHVCEGFSCSDCPFEIFRHHSCRLCNFIKEYPAIIPADTAVET